MTQPQKKILVNYDGNDPPDRQRQPTAMDVSARLHDLERLVSDWLWESDTELTLIYASARSTELFGRHPLTLQGHSLLTIGEFRADFDTQERGDPPEQISRQIPFRDVCYVIPHQDGRPKLLLLSALPVFHEATQAFLGYRGTARDVTAEVEARRQEEQARQQLIDAIEVIDDGFALYDANETLIFANSRIRELSHSCSDLLAKPGTTITQLAYANAQAQFGDAGPEEVELQATERLKCIRAGDVCFDRAEGGKWLRIKEKHTPAGGLVSIRTDITDLVERETAIRVAKEEAELANRTKTEFLANMSHELRTPLNAIIGFAEVMHEELFGELGNPSYKEYANDISTSGRHLLDIINDILDVSKVEAGKLELSEELLQIPQLFASATRLINERANEGKIHLHQELAPDLPGLFADSRKIKQILLNLLSNAVKFTPPDGTVTVTARISGHGDLEISVTDTGIGMSAEQIEIALTPFGQVDSAFTRANQGTGLGLPLCRALATLHGGTLSVDSTPDAGTTVLVTLPKERLEFS
ncbi:MAG: ATP-binding protein [Alphaproteobacteria bacterium]